MKLEDYLLKKSVWKKHRSGMSYFCPQCRASRRIPFHPKSTERTYLARIALTGLFSTVITWPVFGWKGIFATFLYWTGFEVFHRLRKRAALVCDHCGFDPYLYVRDSQLAREEMNVFWKDKFEERGWTLPGEEEDDAVDEEELEMDDSQVEELPEEVSQ